MKHHVNAIIDDDFFQVVKQEKLQEGDFEEGSLMSFGGSHWCRSTPNSEHGSIEVIQNRLTSSPKHRSMTPTESTASCNAVRILSHDEFAVRHPHLPSPVYVKIDRHSDTAVDRQKETPIDRQTSAPIDRCAALTYRVQMPKIDVARLNALMPQPKPSDNPPEAISTPSHDAADPMEVDRVPMGRTLRKRKEKVAKHLKRGANEKEMESFQKRVFRIPLEKPFEEAYFTHRLNATSIDRTVSTSIDTHPHQTSRKRASTDIAYYPSIDTGVDYVREGNYSIGSWADDHHHESYAVETAIHEPGADELHEEATGERTCLSHPIDRANRPSIDNSLPPSIDIRPKPKSTVSKNPKFDNQYLTQDEFGIFRDPDDYARTIDGRALHVSREDIVDILQMANGADNLFMQQHTVPAHP
ncbi:hypothetical protein F2Q68_00039347 [Brassica cretica]|uniref:Uncharacterized protein n=1 Tax=Brassica cretica TaxID=69181 RepID=A0A8S9MED9_BRACR|nr:hypothetical protein F2Q68_00039347 [Brassica cretica]